MTASTAILLRARALRRIITRYSEQVLARKKQTVVNFALFDVFYQDGTRTSNRKVPAEEPYEPDYEGRVKAIIEEQDRDIAEKSGRPRGPIKSIVKSAG